MPDGFWNATYAHLVGFEDVAVSPTNVCTDDTVKWCIRQRSQGWFNNAQRGYSDLGVGRVFVIYPSGNNVNTDKCYVYFMNQHNSNSGSVNPSIVGVDFSEC